VNPGSELDTPTKVRQNFKACHHANFEGRKLRCSYITVRISFYDTD